MLWSDGRRCPLSFFAFLLSSDVPSTFLLDSNSPPICTTHAHHFSVPWLATCLVTDNARASLGYSRKEVNLVPNRVLRTRVRFRPAEARCGADQKERSHWEWECLVPRTRARIIGQRRPHVRTVLLSGADQKERSGKKVHAFTLFQEVYHHEFARAWHSKEARVLLKPPLWRNCTMQ